MKRYWLFNGIAGVLLFTLFMAGCTKEEVTPDDLQKLSFDSEKVLAMVPDGLKNSDDQYAKDCYSFIEAAVDMSQFIDNMEVPDNAVKSSLKSSSGASTWQWSWQYGGESFTFYWSYEEKSGKRYWTMDIQYGGGPRYSYIEAWENIDGSGGEVTYNFAWLTATNGEQQENDDFVYWKYIWSKDGSGAYHLNFTWDSDEVGYDSFIQYEVVINADGSGTIEYYLMDALFYHMAWNVLGDGSWIYYVSGNESLSGTWSV